MKAQEIIAYVCMGAFIATARVDTFQFTSITDFQTGNPINVNANSDQLQVNT